ncbi:TlyA family RNA methyltransferase [Bifidobacterium sp. ESL0790]|uniref:TlyA family RNA methyltransferase n=1 Tax=Bifidobacterium sp. ESL0790 TaxID=2983233 RepID=UPI0023F68982|nr:TlyA family RNA methyltransferase [Bifidobacterium sp. ESL0790]WEV71793.1 TlyA family RNA methyltransferase [Bifidobacterium sp. ESL0790]
MNAEEQPTERLDTLIADQGLAHSRSQAQRLIRDGHVLVDGEIMRKPSTHVDISANLRVDKGDDYVSRGAYKLKGAFECFAADGLNGPQGKQCLDIGASTGGFCDVLLRGGASQVIALDVGHGQLDPRIADDPRIIEMSGVNIRDVAVDDLPFRPQLVVSDVSFISLTFVIPVIARVAAPKADVVLLVKPQFEVGRGHLGKNGIVEDDNERQEALRRVVSCAADNGFDVRRTDVSPIAGTHGNIEYLLYATLR